LEALSLRRSARFFEGEAEDLPEDSLVREQYLTWASVMDENSRARLRAVRELGAADVFPDETLSPAVRDAIAPARAPIARLR
jgi:hypothetical protein